MDVMVHCLEENNQKQIQLKSIFTKPPHEIKYEIAACLQ